MPLVPMKQVLVEATKGKYGIFAFNIRTMEQIQGIMRAALETKSPVILMWGEDPENYNKNYNDLSYLTFMIYAAIKENPDIPVVYHLDHGNSFEICKRAIDIGFTSVMIDGSLKEDSKTVTSFEENVEITKKVVDYAHQFGVTVEGEIGTLGGFEGNMGSGKINLTVPYEAIKFIELTGVDALAIAIGNSHGAYKFKTKPILELEIISKIHAIKPEIPLVMHGASSVPEELISLINKYGGKLKDAIGIPMISIKEAIGRGIVKINIDTDERLAITGAVRKYLNEHPELVDHKKFFNEARDAVYKISKNKMINSGSAGHSYDYLPMTLNDMKEFYNSQKINKIL